MLQLTSNALDGLLEEIRIRSEEVSVKSDNLKTSSYEWQTANNIIIDCCRRGSFDELSKLQNWHQITPTLNIWLNTEGQLQRSIYASAWLLGLQTEMSAQTGIKKLLDKFEDTNYSNLSQIPSSQLPTVIQAQEQRQLRSEAFDQLHWRFSKQLRLMVKQCDYLQLEIESREHVR
jgi:hypothetical protein